MMTFFTLIILILSSESSVNSTSKIAKKENPNSIQMDEGGKQLLKRDVCRKPIEALETKYESISKDQLKKLKAECE